MRNAANNVRVLPYSAYETMSSIHQRSDAAASSKGC